MKIVADTNIPFLKGVLEPYADILYKDGRAIRREDVLDADALIIRTRTRCNADLLDGTRVKLISTATIGTDHIDLDYCARHGITVRNAPGCNAPAVAQWVFAAIHAWMRARSISSPQGLTLGIVGVGHIGSIVARWARQLGFATLLNDPPREKRDGSFDVIFEPLEALQHRCDIITFHTPITRGGSWPTWHLCDQTFLDDLTRCRLILNAARGPITDNAALLRWHGDVALDCWENEPNISRDLLDKAIVATPHIAGYSREGKQRGTAMMLDALNEFYGWNIPTPVIAAPATGATSITLDGIAASYNIMADTACLKAAPTAFEAQRNNYRYRPEYQQ